MNVKRAKIRTGVAAMLAGAMAIYPAITALADNTPSPVGVKQPRPAVAGWSPCPAADQVPLCNLQQVRTSEPRAATADAAQSVWGPADDGFWTTPDGESVYYACYGAGSPVIILEAGTDTGGSEAYTRTFLEPLAERTTTCVYDRLGTGSSDAPLDESRTLDDTRAVLEGLLGAIGWPAPYVLVGQSGGGNLHIDFAAHHPDDVAGLVLIEAYHDDPEAMVAWQAEEGFEWTDNPEHAHYLDASIRLDQLPLPLGDFPVQVMTATHADEGNVENQAYWLDISPDSEQVVIDGTHNLHVDDPAAVTEMILDLLDRVSGEPTAPAEAAPAAIRGCAPACVTGFSNPGPLPEGEFTTTYFLDGHLTLTLEPGWASNEDQGVEFNAAPEGEADVNRVLFWSDLVPVEADGNVVEVANTAADFLAWLGARPGVELTDPVPATIGQAEIPGLMADMAAADDAENEDPGCPVDACIAPFTWVNAGPNIYGTAQPWVLRLYVADVSYGGQPHTLTVAIEAADQATLNAFLPAAERLIASTVAPLEPAGADELTDIPDYNCDEWRNPVIACPGLDGTADMAPATSAP